MTNGELALLYRGILAVGTLEGRGNVKFPYAMAINQRRIKPLVESFDEANPMAKPSDKYKEYEEKRVTLCKEHAQRDEHGKVIMEPSRDPRRPEGYAIDDVRAFEKKLDTLNDEWKETIDEHKAAEESFNELMKEEAKEVPKFLTVKFSNVPLGIKTSQMLGIVELIDEETDIEKAAREKAEKAAEEKAA